MKRIVSYVRAVGLTLVVALTSCSARSNAGAGGSGASQGDAASGSGTSDEGEDDGVDDGAGDVDGGTTFGTDDGGDCGNFLGCNDVGCGWPIEGPPYLIASGFAAGVADVRDPGDCDFWARDCQDGERCTPIPLWSGRPAFHRNFCVPAGTGLAGDPCTIADGPTGTDTCGETSMCLGTSGGAEGRCIEYCSAPESSPTCATPGTRCTLLDGGVAPLCTVPCDPLSPTPCGEPGDKCVAVSFGEEAPDHVGNVTACLPGASVRDSLPGDACYGVLECDEGQACAQGPLADDPCEPSWFCRSVCDLDDAGACGDSGDCLPLGDSAFPGLGYCMPR